MTIPRQESISVPKKAKEMGASSMTIPGQVSVSIPKQLKRWGRPLRHCRDRDQNQYKNSCKDGAVPYDSARTGISISTNTAKEIGLSSTTIPGQVLIPISDN
jgi:hypothetical protein